MLLSQEQKDQQFKNGTIELPNGLRAVSFVDDSPNDTKLAVLPINTLAYLASLIPKGSIEEIMEMFTRKTRDVKDAKEWIAMLRLELEFHTSIELVQEYFVAEPVLVAN